MTNIIAIIWIVSFIYCMWRIVKRYKKSSYDGVTDISINLEIIPVLLLAPVLALADIIVTWVLMIIDYHKKKKKKGTLSPIKESKEE